MKAVCTMKQLTCMVIYMRLKVSYLLFIRSVVGCKTKIKRRRDGKTPSEYTSIAIP